ncbi:MAG: hypothetical protein R3C03_08350 [Pirellulaceae bacterium]
MSIEATLAPPRSKPSDDDENSESPADDDSNAAAEDGAVSDHNENEHLETEHDGSDHDSHDDHSGKNRHDDDDSVPQLARNLGDGSRGRETF